MADSPRSPADGNGGVGGSGGGKRRSPSPPLPFGSPVNRSEAEVRAEADAESEKREEKAPVAAAAAAKAVREPWAKLISQSKQISHVCIFDAEFSIGGSEDCHIHLKDHNASRVLCKLCRLERPSGSMLAVTGKKGLVELNGSRISKGGRRLLEGGEEVAFCKHAFIFQRLKTASDTSPPSGSQVFKDGLKQGILGPDAIEFTLEDFPYYLSPNTKSVLLSAALTHLEKNFIPREKKLIKSLSEILYLSPQILLSGPSGFEIYLETLTKALAKNFGARLLIVDSLLLPVNELRLDSLGYQVVEALGVDELIEVIKEESISTSLIVVLKDVERTLTGRPQSHVSLGKELPPGVLIIGSHTEKDSPRDKGSCGSNSMKHLNNLFPNKISIELPKDEAQLSELKKQLRVDAERLRAKASIPTIRQCYLASLGSAGEKLQACSALLSGYHVPISQVRDFMECVAAYGPNNGLVGQTPAALTWIAQTCGSVGAFLGHVATIVQGVTGIGGMLGSTFRSLARLYGPEVVPEPEPKREAASEPTKITVNRVDQAEQVVKWTAGCTAEVQVDVGPDVTPSMAVNIYNEFRMYGSEALALISGGENMMAKRAIYYRERSV